jgi:hypothetical protein
MADTEHNRSAGEETQGPEGGRKPVDYARYRMNPVQVDELSEPARATPRRAAVVALVLLIIAAGAMAFIFLSARAQEHSPLESLDPDVRDRAHELTENILTRMKSLQGYVYDVEYPSPTTLRIYITPTFVDESGTGHPVTSEEVLKITRLVTEEFQAYGRPNTRLTVQAFVVEDPLEAVEKQPMATGTYDPETDRISASLTTKIMVPKGEGAGAIRPGQGHLGEQGGGMPQEGAHTH